MMLPTLISVSVAPVSYFFCASAPLLLAASNARAAEKAPKREFMASISDLPGSMIVSMFLNQSAWRLLPGIEYLSVSSSKQKAPRDARHRGLISSYARRDYP
jgi:hypothetical protein